MNEEGCMDQDHVQDKNKTMAHGVTPCRVGLTEMGGPWPIYN